MFWRAVGDVRQPSASRRISPPGTRARDRILKPAAYAAAGIPYYWRIEQDPVHVYAYELDGPDRYRIVADSAVELAVSDPFPIRLRVADITP